MKMLGQEFDASLNKNGLQLASLHCQEGRKTYTPPLEISATNQNRLFTHMIQPDVLLKFPLPPTQFLQYYLLLNSLAPYR